MDDFQPLTDIYDHYNASLLAAVDSDAISDEDLAELFVWPVELNISSLEQEDVQKFVYERINEIVDKIHENNGFDPNHVAGILFRAIMCAMMWQSERHGR